MRVLDRFRLDGSRALVTGASRGLGRAAAAALAEAGADVALLARDGERIASLAEEIRGHGGRAVALPWCDVRDEAALRAAVDSAASELGGLDVLVNCAGIEREARLTEVEMDDWRAVIETNLEATFVASQQFVRQLPEGGGGSIVNFASLVAFGGVAAQSPYAASKGGVVSLTRSLAVELGASGVRVNAIVPGYFDTDMPARVTSEPDRLGRLLRSVPLHRLGEPAEIGPLVVYLASPAAAFVSGAAIAIDGGYTAR